MAPADIRWGVSALFQEGAYGGDQPKKMAPAGATSRLFPADMRIAD